MSPLLRRLMFATDISLLAYWFLTACAAAGLVAVPADWLFPHYNDPLVVAWNWSFLPLDLVLSIAGLRSVQLAARKDDRLRHYAFVSLSLTVCAGLMALSFWAIQREFDPIWWGLNLYLMLWPLPFLRPSGTQTPTISA
jgi:hypothetical protein